MTDFVLEISYAADPELDEQVQSELFLSQSTGSSSFDRDGETIVSAYFDSQDARAAAMESLRALRVRLRADDRAHVDWLERYQQSLQPILIGQRFIVAPDARLITDSNRLRIIVPQEQAFGTGSHETTSLCIEMLESIDMRGQRGLDIGAGSGILAIAMLRLGASHVVAFDNDVDAYGPLRENAQRNDVKFATFIGSVEALRAGMFDIITMNILPDVIIALIDEVMPHAAGEILLSGILTERRDDVIRAVPAQLKEERTKGEWWCGRFGVSGTRP